MAVMRKNITHNKAQNVSKSAVRSPAVDPSYGVDSIQIFKGLDGIRKRPSMYLGDTGDAMVFQMLKEIVDNSVDEYQAGRNNYISVTVNNGKSDTDNVEVIVYDRGHGVPTGHNEKENINTLTAVFSMVHAGGKFDDTAYKSSTGTFGTGSSAVNAVSKRFDVWTFWEGIWYYQSFVEGKARTEVYMRCPVPDAIKNRIVGFTGKRGTVIRFIPDQTVVSQNTVKSKLDLTKAVDYLKTLSFLNSKLELIVRSEAHDKNLRFYTEDGISELLDNRITNSGLEYAATKSFVLTTPKLSIAMAWTNYDGEDGIWSYVNSSRTIDGGKHVDGFFAAYQRAIAVFVSKEAADSQADKPNNIKVRGRASKSTASKKTRLQSSLEKISLRDLKVGLLGVMNLRMSGAVYSSQTKEKLTSDVGKMVENTVYPELEKFFSNNPQVIKTIINRAKTIAQGRDQFKQVMKNLSSLKKAGGLFLPNVLVSAPDATPDERELYVCEGLSALGNAKKSRNSGFQEVLALSGKIANASRLPLAKLLASVPIRNLIVSMGADVDSITDSEAGTVLSTKGLRVKRIFMLADQDPDGCHISVLILTVLWRFFPDLFKEGRVWTVNAKLYHANHKGNLYFGDTFDECYEQLPSGASKNLVVRAKGLAEYSVDVLSHIAFEPTTRFVVKIDPPTDSNAVGYFERLVGVDSSERKTLLGL